MIQDTFGRPSASLWAYIPTQEVRTVLKVLEKVKTRDSDCAASWEKKLSREATWLHHLLQCVSGRQTAGGSSQSLGTRSILCAAGVPKVSPASQVLPFKSNVSSWKICWFTFILSLLVFCLRKESSYRAQFFEKFTWQRKNLSDCRFCNIRQRARHAFVMQFCVF